MKSITIYSLIRFTPCEFLVRVITCNYIMDCVFCVGLQRIYNARNEPVTGTVKDAAHHA